MKVFSRILEQFLDIFDNIFTKLKVGYKEHEIYNNWCKKLVLILKMVIVAHNNFAKFLDNNEYQYMILDTIEEKKQMKIIKSKMNDIIL